MRQRLRTYPWIIAATLWSVLLIDFSTPGATDRLGKTKGTDFIQFYAAGASLREGEAAGMYDFRTQHARMRALAPESNDTLYVPIQSPQIALAFSPLAAYRYTVALSIWIGVILLCYAVACYVTWRDCAALHQYSREVLGCAAACPALYSTVLHGQLSVVAVLLIAVALAALRRGHLSGAGLLLGLLAFKPHWVVVAAAVFAIARWWRVVAGIVVAAFVQYAIVWMVLGFSVLQSYWLTLQSIATIGDLLEPRPSNTLKGLFASLMPYEPAAAVLYAVAAMAALVAAAKLWRSEAPFELRASGVVLTMLLISPHAFEYDLILLAPAFLLIANWLVQSAPVVVTKPMTVLLAIAFVAPLVSGVPAVIRLQFSVSAIAALLAMLVVSSRNPVAKAVPSPRPA